MQLTMGLQQSTQEGAARAQHMGRTLQTASCHHRGMANDCLQCRPQLAEHCLHISQHMNIISQQCSSSRCD